MNGSALPPLPPLAFPPHSRSLTISSLPYPLDQEIPQRAAATEVVAGKTGSGQPPNECGPRRRWLAMHSASPPTDHWLPRTVAAGCGENRKHV